MFGMVSVIIPCYNQGKYLSDALDSIYNQSYPNWECIIVDDGSIDNTKLVSMEWVAKDPRFVYRYKMNGGLSSARNYGLSNVKGDFIQFLDADDIILPGKFEIQINAMNASRNSDLAICDYMPSDEYDLSKYFGTERYLSPFFKNNDSLACLIMDWESTLSIPCHCFLFRSYFFTEKKIRFDEQLPNHEDWDCWMQIFANKPNIIQLKDNLAVYRIRQAAMSYDANRMTQGYLLTLKKQIHLLRNESYYYTLLRQKYYLVLSDYKSDNQIDYMRSRFKKKYRVFRKKLISVFFLLKRSNNNL